MNITTNNVPRDLIALADCPQSVQSDFDYIGEDEKYSYRIFKYLGEWFDSHEFVRIRKRSQASGFEHSVDEDSPLLAWHGIQTDSFFSAVVLKMVDNDRIIVGRYSE